MHDKLRHEEVNPLATDVALWVDVMVGLHHVGLSRHVSATCSFCGSRVRSFQFFQ